MNAPLKIEAGRATFAEPRAFAAYAVEQVGERNIHKLIVALADEMVNRVTARMEGARDGDGNLFDSRTTDLFADGLIDDALDIREIAPDMARQMDNLLFNYRRREIFL